MDNSRAENETTRSKNYPGSSKEPRGPYKLSKSVLSDGVGAHLLMLFAMWGCELCRSGRDRAAP